MKYLLSNLITVSLVVCGILGVQFLQAAPPAPITRIDFTAVDESRVHSRLTPRLLLNLSVGTGFPEMDRLNDYATWINRTSAGNVGDIDVYENYRTSLEYILRPGTSVGIGYEFLGAETDGTVHSMGVPRRFEMDLETHGAFAFVRQGWQVMDDPLALVVDASASVGYYWSSYVETEPGYRASGDDGDWGSEVALGLWWLATEHMAVGVEAGYRWLTFDSYGVNWVSPGAPPVEADYTGPTVRLVVSGRF